MRKAIVYLATITLMILICTACNSEENSQRNTETIIDENNEASPDTAYKVVIDPGHGGEDVGAIGASGQYEKDFTLALSLKVKELLESEENIEVYMTREDDSHISQESRYRPKFANEINADLFVSIHGNTFQDSSVSGTETFYYNKSSKSFAKIIHKHLAEATGFRDRGVKREEFFVVKETNMPAVLLEIGYLTNPHEESVMLTDEFQYKVASAIVDGIKEYKTAS